MRRLLARVYRTVACFGMWDNLELGRRVHDSLSSFTSIDDKLHQHYRDFGARLQWQFRDPSLRK